MNFLLKQSSSQEAKYFFDGTKIIMLTRKKWTSKEDNLLKEIVKGQEKPYKWDVISYMLKKKGIDKSSK